MLHCDSEPALLERIGRQGRGNISGSLTVRTPAQEYPAWPAICSQGILPCAGGNVAIDFPFFVRPGDVCVALRRLINALADDFLETRIGPLVCQQP